MKSKRALFHVLAALVAGCVPIMSLQPLLTEENLTFDERLLGSWVEDANNPKSSWEFSRLSSADPNMFPEATKDMRGRIYRLDLRDKDNHKGVFIAILGRLGSKLFLDIFPASFPSGQADTKKVELLYNAVFFVRTHTFVRIEIASDELKMKLTDDEKFKDLIQAEPNAIQYDTVESRIVLTASTKDLQAFAMKYADDKRLFANEVVLSRKPSK
jgi:hypothetical protein